ncbi:CDP-glucose-4,6-dehydratase [gamma proteobacterium HdN1]|nr:CDP-glucose-4,6-dehydratase [gamma proteobacterium HdN1]
MSEFKGFYAGKRVLVTGHTGFKGSWLSLWLQMLGAQVQGFALDPDTTPCHWNLLNLSGIEDVRGDLRDADALRDAILKFQPELVFHLAAQPLVRYSYRHPVETFATNITGLVNLLETCRICPSIRVLVNATTDKVYAEPQGHANDEGKGYRESDPLGGHDPYSTSKACAEMISDCYRKSFFSAANLRIATARAGNVIGGGDWADDRLVPDLIRAATNSQPLQIRNPGAIRPWQHVLEPLSGYLRLAQLLWDHDHYAAAWNFGPGRISEITVQTLGEQLKRYWPALHIETESAAAHTSIAQHPHEAKVLRLDSGAAQQQLGWQPIWNITETLAHTAHWYQAFYERNELQTRSNIHAYTETARNHGLDWARHAG